MRPTDGPDDDLDLLHRLADAADGLTLPVWQTGKPVVTVKADGSPVTDTDPAVERAIRAIVGEAHPDDGFLGEEVGDHPGRSDRRWIVDGIDGTRSFVDGGTGWTTLIGRLDAGRPTTAMITSPVLSRRWFATTRSGPWTVGMETAGGAAGPSPVVERLAVSTTDALSQARVAFWPADLASRTAFVDQTRALRRLLAELPAYERPTERPAPHGALLVADGRADVHISFGGQAWDHAAFAALVTSAGGRYTALDGSDAIDTGSGVYSNGRVHDALIEWLTGR